MRIFIGWWLTMGALGQQQTADPAIAVERLEKETGQLSANWLRSDDPRTQAWGAYVALKDRQTERIPDLLALLSTFSANGQPVSLGEKDQHDAMMAVLDALIQLGAEVPPSDAEKIYAEFPVQSLLLLQRAQPVGKVNSILFDIFRNEKDRPGAWLAAGNLLAARNVPGFAAAVMGDMTVRVLALVSSEAGSGGGFGGSCYAMAGGQPKQGWPEVGNYRLSNCTYKPGASVLATGVDPAYYIRTVDSLYAPAGMGACACYPDFDLVREHYLTKLLGMDSLIKSRVTLNVTWKGEDAYRSEMLAFILQQRELFASVARRLQVPADNSPPKLEIEIGDLRVSKTPALPEIDGVTSSKR